MSVSSVEFVISNYDGSHDADKAPHVNICKAEGRSVSTRSDAADAVVTALDDLYSRSDIPGYTVSEWNVAYSPEGSNKLQNWGDWLESNHNPDPGSWILLHGDYGPNAAESGGGWSKPAYGMASTLKASNHSQFLNLVIHEAFHPLINNGCSYAASYMDMDNGGHHSLGKDNYEGTDAYRTPMATGHGVAVIYGNCSNDNEAFGVQYTRIPTSCTGLALSYSASHYFDGH